MINKVSSDVIKSALTVLEKDDSIVQVKNGRRVVENKYEGYLSSFGGSIVQTGLYGTVCIYEASDEKCKVLLLLCALYKHAFQEKLSVDQLKERSKDPIVMNQLRNRLVQCAVALKLAFRTMESIQNE